VTASTPIVARRLIPSSPTIPRGYAGAFCNGRMPFAVRAEAWLLTALESKGPCGVDAR
jgi:hypothetical protein